MKVVLQRVKEASVEIDGEVVGEVGRGYAALVGCRAGDTSQDVAWLADKMVALRVFEDGAGKMNKSLRDVGGSVLLISQFTLYADTSRGNRPGFSLSGDPATARKLYEEFVELARAKLGAGRVATGVFAADMLVRIANDGPVTIELCSDGKFQKG